jgi:hypothetical protein
MAETVLGEGPAERAQQLVQPVAVGAGQRVLGVADQLLRGQPEQLVDEGVLAGEPPVDGTDPDLGPGGDLLHARSGPPAALLSRRADGMSRPAAAASRSPPAMTANPVA